MRRAAIYPTPDPAIEVDPNTPTPLLPPFRVPGDGYVLRETAAGWRDDQRTAFAGSGDDRPLKADPILSFVVSPAGDGWAIGGWSGDADSAGRGTSARGAGANAARERVQTTGIYRYSPAGSPAGPSTETAAPVPLPAGPVRFAVGGHAMCQAPCADLANQEIAPDRILGRTLDLAAGLAARDGGPRAFLYTGGRVNPAAGASGDPAEEARYGQLLASRPSLPVFGAVAEGDVAASGTAAFRQAFAGAPAPFGGGRHSRRRHERGSERPDRRRRAHALRLRLDRLRRHGARHRHRQLEGLAGGVRSLPESQRRRSSRGSARSSTTPRPTACPRSSSAAAT